MMEGSVLLAPLQNLLSFFQRDAHFKSAQKDAALAAIDAALNATLKYIEDSDGQKCFDRETEYQLSTLWGDAARKVRHVSRDLSTRLQDKADYWADKLEWSSSEVLDRKIRITEIRAAYRELLANV